MKNTAKFEQNKKLLTKVVDDLKMEIEVTEELVFSIFGDNLEVENTEEELKEMFLFEL